MAKHTLVEFKPHRGVGIEVRKTTYSEDHRRISCTLGINGHEFYINGDGDDHRPVLSAAKKLIDMVLDNESVRFSTMPIIVHLTNDDRRVWYGVQIEDVLNA